MRIRYLPGMYGYLLTHPEAVEHVLRKQHKNYRKPAFFNRTMELLVGKGVFTSEGEFWTQHRQLMQPAFHRQHLAQLSRLMVSAAEACRKEWGEAGTEHEVDIAAEMMRLALSIAGLTLFGTDLGQETEVIGQAFRAAFEETSHRLNTPPLVPGWLPTPRNRRFARNRRLLDQVVLGMIAERRRDPEAIRDLLSLLLSAQDEETGIGLTDEEVKDEALILLTAGHETVGAALSWTWYLLGQHPAIQESLHDEVRGLLEGRSPTIDDLPDLPLARAVFEEALRLYPPAWGVPREAIEEDEILGCQIPKGVPLIICQYVTHRRPDVWEQPERFKPERFLSAPASQRPRFAYYPFGGGPRICIGSTFALTEGPLVLATLIQSYRVELVPEHPVVPDPTFTLRPKHGVRVKLRRRSAGGEGTGDFGA